ncbi:MAG TPA: sigma-70 family RNA polymerase sigma factor [Acidimicrobiales bacterium]|nr:sigma-70 family RNA polymerase sigma factor [Acidimicrobiales bacterium]
MPTDAELAIAAASGDRDAFADIYDRYADALYELCRAVLGDAHEASDALHDTFVIAATRLGGLRDPSRLKPWLCAIARHESMRRSSRRARNRPVTAEVLDVPVADDSARGLMADDAATLVWEAADALTDRERAVLVLNVRQGLEGAELAAAAGLPGPTVSVLLSRAKSQLATAVRCTLLIRHGRDACPELAQIVPRKHMALDGLIRKRVARHAPDCTICAPTWNSSPDALGLLAAAPLVGAPVALRHAVLNDPRLISFSTTLGGGGWQRDGFPPPEPVESRRRIVVGLAAAMVAVLVAVGMVLIARGGDDDKTVSAGAPRSHRTTTSDVEDFAPWPTDPPHASTTTTIPKTTTTTRPRATTTTHRAAVVPPVTTVPAPTTTTEPPLNISASSAARQLSCHSSTNVTATTSGRALRPGETLFLRWQDATGSGSTVSMHQSGNSWTAELGPIDSPGTASWSVFTNESASSGTHTITVADDC